MGFACLLALCAIGAVSGKNLSGSTTDNKHQSSGTEVFLSIGESFNATHDEPAEPLETHQTPESLFSNVPYLQIRDQFANTETKITSSQQPGNPGNSRSVIHVSQEPIQTFHTLKRPRNPDQVVSQLDEGDPEGPSDVKRLRAPDSSLSFQRIFVPAPVFNIYAPKGSVNLNVGVGGQRVSFELETQEAVSGNSGNPKKPKVTISGSEEEEEIEDVKAPVANTDNHDDDDDEDRAEDKTVPFSEGSPLFDTSEQMIQSFLRQSPSSPELPAVIPDLSLPDRLPSLLTLNPVNSSNLSHVPPRPDFNRSMRLRVDLVVPGSDYIEAYDIEWHAPSNTARTVIEDGSTIIYRMPSDDGRVRYLEVQLQIKNRRKVRKLRHCTLSPLMPASPSDRSFPGLPALDQFEFTGYTSAEGRSLVERWRRVVTGGPGEGGAADGESLTFTHEMLIIRDKGQAVPLRYTVVTDSSVLGPASDSYTHHYSQLPAPTAALRVNLSRECQLFEHYLGDVDKRRKRDLGNLSTGLAARFDPIREFAGPMRDTRYDSIFTKFKTQFKRKYLDLAEETVRKNLLIKSSRFIEAGNRLTSGFKMAVNFLADRLDDEINQLFGVQAPPEGSSEPSLLPFPYSDDELKKLSNELDEDFDWRLLHAVSPVRFQETTCSSSWAFAVAGSTEGAHFLITRKLEPLSPQSLIDCGKPFGTNGCNGTWPSFAYDYVRAHGLPSWDDYTYQAKVLECKAQSVQSTSPIGGHVNVIPFSETALKVAIKKHGSSVVLVDAKAKSFIYYEWGVLKDKRCGQSKPRLNHAALAVGWGVKAVPYFIIKNSWSDLWGEEGYIRIAPDSCAVLEKPSFASFTRVVG